MTLLPLVRTSVGMMRARPLASFGLGALVVLSSGFMCCGAGLFAAPFFATQLLQVQLGMLRGIGAGPGPRGPGPSARRCAAMGVWLASVGLTLAAGALGLIAGSASRPDMAGSWGGWDLPLVTRAAALGSAVLGSALLFNLPALYAPRLLLEKRLSVFDALLESARLVAAEGLLHHLAFLMAAYGLPVLVVFVGLAQGQGLAGLRPVLLSMAMAVTVASLAFPFGQGLITAAYVQGQERHGSASASAGPLPGPLRVLWAGLWLTPLWVALLLGVSVLIPSNLSRGALAQSGGHVIEAVEGQTRRFTPRGAAITIEVARTAVKVTVDDGGGVGRLPLADRTAPVDRVRVVEIADHFGVEVWQGVAQAHAVVDGAGVRLDDGLAVRLWRRLPQPVAWSLWAVWIVQAIGMAHVMTSLGRVRGQLVGTELGLWQSPAGRRAVRRAMRMGLGLAPLALWLWVWALRALW